MANNKDWIRTQLGFEEGAITTRDTVYAGFGLEGLRHRPNGTTW